MIEIKQYQTYRIRIKYHRTDDLVPDALPNGSEINAKAMWIADEGERYEGDWIFQPVETAPNLPERDLEILYEKI